MAKQDSNRHQQGLAKRYYEQMDTIQSNKLSQLVSDLWLAEGEKAKTKLWGQAQVALMRIGVNATKAASIVGKRDVEQLAELVAQVDVGKGKEAENAAEPASVPAPAINARSVADGRTIQQMQAQKASDGGYDSLEEPNLKRALKAFRRKIKTLKRDDESRLGSRYTTVGRVSTICAITPPRDYPMDVWNKLVELGRLKKGGSGTFELP